MHRSLMRTRVFKTFSYTEVTLSFHLSMFLLLHSLSTQSVSANNHAAEVPLNPLLQQVVTLPTPVFVMRNKDIVKSLFLGQWFLKLN
jgi:hypothetical protein